MAIQAYKNWQLPQNLLQQSSKESKFPEVINEWVLSYVRISKVDFICLCTRKSISKIYCEISNTKNQKTALIGNCCVTRLKNYGIFKAIYRIFYSSKTIIGDKSQSSEPELLDYSYKKQIITELEYESYKGLLAKSSRSTSDHILKVNLNQRIITAINGDMHLTSQKTVAVKEKSILETQMSSTGSKEADNTNWSLPEQLLKKSSEGSTFPDVLNEWKLSCIEARTESQVQITCLCFRKYITMYCYLSNTNNKKSVLIGECCVKKLQNHDMFKYIYTIFCNLKAISKDINKHLSPELLDYVNQHRIINPMEYFLYSLQPLDPKLVQNLNRRITSIMCGDDYNPEQYRVEVMRSNEHVIPIAERSEIELFNDLKSNPESIADIRLIRLAFKQRVIKDIEMFFYMEIIENKKTRLSDDEQHCISKLNRTMIRSLTFMDGQTLELTSSVSQPEKQT